MKVYFSFLVFFVTCCTHIPSTETEQEAEPRENFAALTTIPKEHSKIKDFENIANKPKPLTQSIVEKWRRSLLPTKHRDIQNGASALFITGHKYGISVGAGKNYGMATLVSTRDNICISATAAHVVENKRDITIKPWSGIPSKHHEKQAKIEVVSQSNDIALISHDCFNDSLPNKIKISTIHPKVGSRLIGFGQPAPHQGAVSEGIVSGYWTISEFNHPIMVSSIKATYGFSGGPVLNNRSELVGIIVGRTSSEIGYSYIVPSVEVLILMKELKDRDEAIKLAAKVNLPKAHQQNSYGAKHHH